MHRFKEFNDKLIRDPNNFKHDTKNPMTYYDHMSALLSIYLDLKLDLQYRIQKYQPHGSNRKKNKQNMCLNVVYLLGKFI